MREPGMAQNHPPGADRPEAPAAQPNNISSMSQNLIKIFAIAALSALLAGCGTDKANPLCPGAAALVEASNLTGFPPGASADPAHALYRVAISNVTTDCSIDPKARTADSSLTIHFVATRAPNGDAVSYRVPYFVAVRQGPNVITKKVFWVRFGFDAGQASASFSQPISSTVVHIANKKQPYDYQILVGLQLTRAQLEYNRKIGHYGP